MVKLNAGSYSVQKKNIILIAILTTIFLYLCIELYLKTIAVVQRQNLLPLWDPATHSLYGWELYFYLKNFNLPMFFWAIWSKGIWPFMYYLYQVPFYIFFNNKFEGALVSSVFSFGIIGVLSSIFLRKLLINLPLIAISIFIFLFISTPVYLAFSSLPMTEIFGVFMQLMVFTSYLLVTDTEVSNLNKRAVLFAVSLTLLFFTKYNYFILVVVPIIINEYLSFTKTLTFKEKCNNLLMIFKNFLSGITGIVLIVYFVFLYSLILTDGFEFNLFSIKVSVHSIGNTGYIVLYFLLIRFWYLNKKKKISLNKLYDKDYRIRPLIYYFVIPLLIWFAIPYPNHIREFFNSVVNRNTEGITLMSSIPFYFNILRNDYFQNDIFFFAAISIFLVALIRYKSQTRKVKWLIIASISELLLVTLHPYKDARFIFTALLPFWLIIAVEITNWIERIINYKIILYAISIIIIVLGIISFNNALEEKVFNKYAFRLYTHSSELNCGFDWIKKQLRNYNSEKDTRLAVIGGISNTVSPALLEWELGKPTGYEGFIGVVPPNDYKKIIIANFILIIEPKPDCKDLELRESFESYSEMIKVLLAGKYTSFVTEKNISDPGLIFRIYEIKPI